MRRVLSNRIRWSLLATALTFGVSLAAASGAQAIVVDMSQVGNLSATVPYNAADQNYGVALAPVGDASSGGQAPGNSGGVLHSVGIPVVASAAACADPGLSSDLTFLPAPSSPLCWHGGSVIHNNEVFDLSWDPMRRSWATTRHYVEQFLRDVADGSGTLTSPFAVTPQYTDGNNRAANASVYGGGCVDFGATGGSCQFGDTTASAAGHDYPAQVCTPTGNNVWDATPNGPIGTGPNDVCLTDAQIRGELQSMIPQSGLDLTGHIKPGYTPLVVLMTPPGVVTCLDAAGTLCSANSGSTAQFCSYHSQVNVGGTEVNYVVLPWVAHWSRGLICDDSDAPKIPVPVDVSQLATDVGARLVSPLSQGELATLVNPGMDGWRASDGSEINDNGCSPVGNSSGLDNEFVNGVQYPLQREFNNAGAIETDPNALPCTPVVNLGPAFVVPSAVNPGDVVQFDGSKTVSTLLVPKANYAWSFGDGTGAVGPSVVHSYGAGGVYNVKLTVTDRGGNVATLTQQINVLGANGQPVSGGPTPTPPGQGASGLSVHLQLKPQSLKSVLSSGMTVRVTSNQAADGIATVSIPRSAAKRAHIQAHGAAVRIGLGTVQVRNGTATLRVRFSRSAAAKLRKLGHVTLTLRLALVAHGGVHRAYVIAGRY
jgi:PKD domain